MGLLSGCAYLECHVRDSALNGCQLCDFTDACCANKTRVY